MTRLAADRVERAFRWACALDVQVRKPGNVSLDSAGHRMVAQQFLDSAAAAAPALAAPGASVGARIEGAVSASLAAAGCNTNLGIVLLCAPLAAAAQNHGAADAAALRSAVARELAALTVADAAAAYRAIAAANPGGLGRAGAEDVAQEPTVDLRRAMSLAADRDSIARQYAQGFPDVFDVGLAAWRAERAPGPALFAAWLAYLAQWPDTHIVRKHGPAAAHSVTKTASRWRDQWQAHLRHPAVPWPDPSALQAWDEALKSAGINPGTSADLAVATAFAAALLQAGGCEHAAG